ncbi:hypothetical protein BD309DRAFT_386542 [Dichomitus squalens]|nr:hypothetical protein BD309DRAFT_386542 [Dichomitus squalens]
MWIVQPFGDSLQYYVLDTSSTSSEDFSLPIAREYGRERNRLRRPSLLPSSRYRCVSMDCHTRATCHFEHPVPEPSIWLRRNDNEATRSHRRKPGRPQ